MATVSFSPTGSISSHTLSAQSNQPTPQEAPSAYVQTLLSTLSASPHAFLQPTSNLHNATLSLAKHFLDPLASGVSEVQRQRQQEARKKRKRGDSDDVGQPLQLKKVHLEGFGVNQVWEQARRVLDAAREEVENALPEVQDNAAAGAKTVRFDDEGFEMTGSEDEDEDEEGSDVGEEGVDWEYDGEDVSGDEEGDSQVDGVDGEEEVDGEDGEDIEMDGDDFDDEDMSEEEEAAAELVPDRFGLNDGFFSIDDFNKQSEFLEQQDARGDADQDAASDEEEVDWNTDPLNAATGETPPSKTANGAADESEDEDGPTFGDADLNAPEGASDDGMDDESLDGEDMDGMGAMTNTNNVMYADFFAPPAQKASKKKRGRPNPHNFPAKEENGPKAAAGITDEDVERTMAAVHRDLFDESEGDDGSDLSDADPSDPKSRKSTHERRQAKLAEEIRRLEAANVAKREWVMSGEAKAIDRPQNSLLEQDLDFERAGKPVPVITAEISEDIESLIKRRILARQFDEVTRRRPEDIATGSAVRRGKFELDDTKASKGLAEEYEEEHLKKTDPNHVDAKDEKLRKAHKEIESLWRDVSAKLDSLSSWHYKPKPAAPSLEIRTDTAAISMEDARPTAGGDIGGGSMLAPQEVYAPGDEKNKGEVVTKGGLPVAREEMSREEKLRRRRREKERIKKSGGGEAEKAKESKKTRDRKGVVGDLKKGGVKVIGKKGQVTDVEGKEVKEQGSRGGAGNFKL
ncbi:Mpp10 protein [Saccharata proteae CBS 121410]|uniref:U3 small nucleolar ribonucleoprotein protein MPP10 n=1 Tax=Saccharata proteae CBS 121410 TaxID=1314787 RepID=A0A9P4LYK9_9PEZI|nr:Mpp10 protein [Saccharata proteae CBS 121410]